MDVRVGTGVAGKQAADVADGLREFRLGAGEFDPRIGGIKFDQDVAGRDPVGVVGEDARHGAGHFRGDLYQLAADIGVVGVA